MHVNPNSIFIVFSCCMKSRLLNSIDSAANTNLHKMLEWSTAAYLVVAVVTSSLSFWVRTLNSWLKSTGRNRMITGILSMLRRPWNQAGGARGRKRREEDVHSRIISHWLYMWQHSAVNPPISALLIRSRANWFNLTFRQLRKLEVGGSERSSSLFWHCWKNRFRWESWHREVRDYRTRELRAHEPLQKTNHVPLTLPWNPKPAFLCKCNCEEKFLQTSPQ